MTERFTLAPMSGLIRGLTAVVLGVPPLLVVLGLLTSARILVPIGIAIAIGYLAIRVAARPSAFELSREGLRIVFPWRTRTVAAREIAGVRLVSGTTFRDEYGFAIRIGVGGLWGGFGWLWTSQRGLVELYVSRLDGLVLIERRGRGAPILLTPVEPEEFVDTLAALL